MEESTGRVHDECVPHDEKSGIAATTPPSHILSSGTILQSYIDIARIGWERTLRFGLRESAGEWLEILHALQREELRR